MLRRIAQQHRLADEYGVAPGEVPALHEERTGPSRRALLGGAVAAGAALAVGTGAKRADAATAPRIVIVGAGISGLCAALQLQDHGVASTVYEANTRVGGRMFSNMAGAYWDAGQVSEWGGELIDTDHQVMQALAKRFNLTLDDLRQAEPNGSTQTYYFAGRYYTYTQACNDFQPVHQAIQADMQSFAYPVLWNSNPNAAGIALSNMSVYDWIETRVPGGHSSNMGKLLDVAYNIEFGSETKDQTALGLLGLLAYQPNPGQFRMFGISDERYHIRGGNQQLPLAIQAALPSGSVLTGYRLTAVAANSDGTQTLTFARPDGSSTTVVADHTILAVPQGVLKRLDLSRAGLDARKTGCIAAMPMGRNGKLQLQFTSRLWNTSGPWGISNGETYADTGYQNTWEVSRAQPGTQGILVDYTGGNTTGAYVVSDPFTTVSTTATANYARQFLTEIEPVFPGLTALWNGRATLSDWIINPYSYGSYSYWPTGYCQNYAGYEGVRQGNLHFAGEHCSVNQQGYMEGGAEEGQRAANEIISDLGLK
jgi:monoamine oxidase